MTTLAEILPDLFGIEVNTIIKDEMSAQKMPSLPHALHDIIQSYGEKLESYGVDLSAFFQEEKISEAVRLDEKSRASDSGEKRKPDLEAIFPPSLLKPVPPGTRYVYAEVRNGWISFDIIRLIARYLMKGDSGFSPAKDLDPPILERIRRNCDQLTSILRTLELNPAPRRPPWWRRIFPDRFEKTARWTEVLNKTRHELLDDDLRTKRLPLDTINTEDLARIRKMWEIGTETVLVQTCIQIDGDVVTRLGRCLYDGKHAEYRKSIIEAHRESVDVSLTQWHGLVKVAVELVSMFFKGLAGLRSGK
jgi:hypothetical protein